MPTGVSVYARCCAQLKGTSMCCYGGWGSMFEGDMQYLIHGTEEKKMSTVAYTFLGIPCLTISRQVTGTFDDLKNL